MLEGDTLLKYSKSSASGPFNLSDYVQYTFQAGTYSVNDFNTKIKAAVLQKKQNWSAPQIKDLKLIIQENYGFTAFNKFFIGLGAPNSNNNNKS